jgi:putative nucleotidyltransferase with HDIG domain
MNNGRILVVDDDPLIRSALKDILSGVGGYEVDVAVNGMEGINKIKRDKYDIIFTDLTMPRVNGMDLLKETRSINSSLPVVVITGFSTIENAVLAMKEGAYDFLTKPFRIDRVISLVRRISGEKKLLNDIAVKDDYKASVERLNAELFKRLQEASIFQSLSSEFDCLYSNGDIYRKIVEMVTRLLIVRESSFGIVEGGYLRIKSAIGAGKKDIPIANSIFETVIRKSRYSVASCGEINPHTGEPLSSSFLSIPLSINDEVFGVLNLADKADGTSFTEDEIYLALNFAKKAELRIENNALYDVLYESFVNALKSLVITIEARDPYLKHHSERVTSFSLQIAEVLGLGDDDKEAIRFGGYLHDIGKIGVRDTLLLKPDELSPLEMEEVRLHTIIGDNIMKPLNFFEKEKPLIRNHHEWFDGSGYPDGLAGEDIPLIVRVLAVADAYDAMTSSRPYRKARSHGYATEEIRKGAGSQFDAEVVRAFLSTPLIKEQHD